MSWVTEEARRLYGGDSVTADVLRRTMEEVMRKTVEECARRAHGVAANWPPHGAGTGPVGALAVRDQIRAMLEDT